MNYCGHCGTRLEADGRCPVCSAADDGLPRIVEQTAPRLPPPPPPGATTPPPPPPPRAADPNATVALPTAGPTPAVDSGTTVAMNATAAAASPPGATAATPAWQVSEPTRIIRTDAPAPWDDAADVEYASTIDDPQSARRSQLATVGVIAAILLLAGLGVVLWNLLADDPDSIETLPEVSTTLLVEPTATVVQTTLPAPGTTAEGTLPERPPLTIAPTVPTLVAPTAPGTIPVVVPVTTGAAVPVTTARPAAPATDETATDPPVETDPRETFPPQTAPPVPPPPPADTGAGEPQVLQDPLPSGISYGAARESHLLSQRLADALAAEDWATARALSPALASSSDATLANGYGGLDRASLILVDAREEGDSTRLLIVSVANELGSRTSLYCFEWTAQPGAGTVRQGGGVGRIARADGALSPNDVRADERLSAAIRDDCVWS